MVIFSKGIEPCRDGKIFSHCFFTVFFSISIHIQNQHTYETTGIGDNVFQGTCFGYGFSVFQFVKNPAGCGICTHKDSFCQCITLADAAGKVWNFNGKPSFFFFTRVEASRIS